MTIRVLRLLEYEYEDAERMAKDMAHWTIGANASYQPGAGMTIRSAVLPADVFQLPPPHPGGFCEEHGFVEARVFVHPDGDPTSHCVECGAKLALHGMVVGEIRHD